MRKEIKCMKMAQAGEGTDCEDDDMFCEVQRENIELRLELNRLRKEVNLLVRSQQY